MSSRPWTPTLLAAAVLASCAAPRDQAARARDVERRVLAPCCRRQTLEDHDSDIARKLRLEIETRTQLGEPPEAIEDDLVRRYGPEILVMPRTWDARLPLGAAVAGVVLLGGLVVLRLARRRRSSPPDTATGVAAEGDRVYEELLDDELLDVD